MYIAGIGIGTLIGNLVFILGGRLIVDRLNNNQHIIQYVIGSIFAITAMIILYKMIRKKDPISGINENPTHEPGKSLPKHPIQD